MRVCLMITLLALILPAESTSADGDPTSGSRLFSRCSACHSVTGQNKVGPYLNGVVGRTAATAQGARYSKAMSNSGIEWDAENLDQFLNNPRKLIPGTTMAVSVANPNDRADIIAYLSSLAESQP